jgi:hypothetical protein
MAIRAWEPNAGEEGDVEQIKAGHGDLVQMDWDPISRIVLAKGSP